MSANNQRIEPLPPEVVAKLKSSTSITHLNAVVVELVKNALDANAHTIYVTVDFKRGGCVIDDDGDGIPPTEFESNGGLGRPYHTSKFYSSREVYGRQGSFLASLASLSLLTITSHHAQYPSTNTLIIHHSTTVARLIPAPASRGLRFSSHGTCITVNDLFGNMPVRVKNRALALQKPDEVDRQWDDLRHLLVSLMLANDSLTKLVVSDASRDKKFLIRLRSQGQPGEGALDLQRISSVLAQAGLAGFQNPQCWNAVSATLPDISIHAAISLKPSPTKKTQFISVGMNPIYPRNSTNLLYSETNNLFFLSDFGAMGGPPLAISDRGQVESRDYGGTKSNPLSKTANKWPMFYIRIDANAQEIDDVEDVPESDRPIKRIVEVLGAMITEFLKQHGLRPRAEKSKGKANQAQFAAQDTGKLPVTPGHLNNVTTEETLTNHFKLPSFSMPLRGNSDELGNWSKAKVAKDSFSACSSKRPPRLNPDRPSTIANNDSFTNEPVRESPLSTPRTFEEPNPRQEPQNASGLPARVVHDKNQSAADRIVSWTDPYTGRSHLINSRTGQSVGIPHIITNQVDQIPRSTGCLQTARNLTFENRPKSAMPKSQSTWVSNLLEHWENPAFRRSEQPIHAIDAGHNNVADAVNVSTELCGFETAGISKFRGKLLKQDLENAEVIAQVDQKFILAKLKATVAPVAGQGPAATLVLIDQHAADERCRVEALCEELLTPVPDHSRRVQTATLEPLVFEIPIVEKSILGRYQDFFRSWGIEYAVEQKPGEKSAFLFVHRVPLLIAERCRVEPNLVIELIRGELWSCEETRQRPDRTDEEQGWVNRLKGCPQGLVDLLNSRACRTAIMFNDQLTAEECQHLVSRLAQCVFPFQCAHGRPSMIPVVDIDGTLDGDETHSGDSSELGFIETFQKWEPRF